MICCAFWNTTRKIIFSKIKSTFPLRSNSVLCNSFLLQTTNLKVWFSGYCTNVMTAKMAFCSDSTVQPEHLKMLIYICGLLLMSFSHLIKTQKSKIRTQQIVFSECSFIFTSSLPLTESQGKDVNWNLTRCLQKLGARTSIRSYHYWDEAYSNQTQSLPSES